MDNYWLSVDETIHTDVGDYFGDPDNYSGDVPAADARIFVAGIPDFNSVSNMYKPFNSTFLYSFYTEDPNVLNTLLADYPTIEVLGSWDNDGNLLTTISNDLLNYMPDIFDVQTQQFVSATVLTDVNMLFGQPQRSFI